MITCYIRSSSVANWEYCQTQYYFNYILGMRSKSNLRADIGSVVHKVLECLAEIKLNIQNKNKEFLFENEMLSKPIYVKSDELLIPTRLSNEEVDTINKTRINKYTYKTPCFLSYGHIRYGISLVENLIQQIYTYYKDNTEWNWTPVTFKDVTNFTWMALDYRGGTFDPRKRNILKPEQAFNIELNQPWAKYAFKLNGKPLEGQLTLRGTVDLLTTLEDDIIELIDWKTGQRLNWATGKEKTYRILNLDPQLMIYYYAIKHLYPRVKQVLVTIFYIRDGGPFTLVFDEEYVAKTEEMLAKHFDEVKRCQRPTMTDPFQKHFKCTKLCDYYKMESPEPEVNMCRFIQQEIQKKGIQTVTDQYHQNKIKEYEKPGEI